ncbi:MAG TPA: hypothetical protein VMX74_12600 [Pirellulales bacterium]|nr:hypothetical protein [Pirellulales bacterium]
MSESGDAMPNEMRITRALKIAVLFWLLAWLIKARFLVSFFASVCTRYPLSYDFFPSVASSPWVSLVAYFAPCAAAGIVLISQSRRVRTMAVSTLVVCSALLCVHQNAYNDATFVTSFWAGLWLLWLSTRDPENAESVGLYGPVLAQAIVSLMFLGGAIGKLTPEYWSGEAFYHLYFLQKASGVYPWLREAVSDATLRWLAGGFAKTVIVAELCVGGCFLLSSRTTLWLSVFTMAGVVAISTSLLFSVMGSLIGISLAGIMLSRLTQPGPATACSARDEPARDEPARSAVATLC